MLKRSLAIVGFLLKHQKLLLKIKFSFFNIIVYKLWNLVLVLKIIFRGWTLLSVKHIILREDVSYELSYLVEFKLLSAESSGKVDGSKIMMSANFEQKVKKRFLICGENSYYFSFIFWLKGRKENLINSVFWCCRCNSRFSVINLKATRLLKIMWIYGFPYFTPTLFSCKDLNRNK